MPAAPESDLAVLLVVHALPPLEHSGTPAIALGYANHLAALGLRVAVLAGAGAGPGLPPLRVIREAPDAFQRYEVPWTAHAWHAWSLEEAGATDSRPEVLYAVLDDFRPDLVHVIDLVNLPGAWPDLLRGRGVPVLRQVWNAEDLCGMIEPMFPEPPAAACPAPLTPRQCAACCFRQLVTLRLREDAYSVHRLLRHLEAVRDTSLAQLERQLEAKRLQAERQFRGYDRVLFPTASFREFFERTLPLAAERTSVLEPGIDLPPTRPAEPPARDEPVQFLFLGNLLSKKGVDDLAAVFSHPDLLGRTDYRVRLCGGGDAGALRGLLARNPLVRHQGPFTPGQLPGLVAAAHVGLSPSRFETFHRVTREYLRGGLAVLGSTAFGIPDAVRPGDNGVLFDAGDAEGFRRTVVRVLDDRGLLARLMAGARRTAVRTTGEEAGDLVREYRVTLTTTSFRRL